MDLVLCHILAVFKKPYNVGMVQISQHLRSAAPAIHTRAALSIGRTHGFSIESMSGLKFNGWFGDGWFLLY